MREGLFAKALTLALLAGVAASWLVFATAARSPDLDWRPAGVQYQNEASLVVRLADAIQSGLGSARVEAQGVSEGPSGLGQRRSVEVLRISLGSHGWRFAGSGPAHRRVGLHLDGASAGTAEVGIDGLWQISAPVPAPAPGDHRVSISVSNTEGAFEIGQELRIFVPERWDRSREIVISEGAERAAGSLRTQAERLALEASRAFDEFSRQADKERPGARAGQGGQAREADKEPVPGTSNDEAAGAGEEAPRSILQKTGNLLRGYTRDYHDFVIPELARRGGQRSIAALEEVPLPQRPDETRSVRAFPDVSSVRGSIERWLRDANRVYQEAVVKDLAQRSERIAKREVTAQQQAIRDVDQSEGREPSAPERPAHGPSEGGRISQLEQQRAAPEAERPAKQQSKDEPAQGPAQKEMPAAPEIEEAGKGQQAAAREAAEAARSAEEERQREEAARARRLAELLARREAERRQAAEEKAAREEERKRVEALRERVETEAREREERARSARAEARRAQAGGPLSAKHERAKQIAELSDEAGFGKGCKRASGEAKKRAVLPPLTPKLPERPDVNLMAKRALRSNVRGDEEVRAMAARAETVAQLAADAGFGRAARRFGVSPGEVPLPADPSIRREALRLAAGRGLPGLRPSLKDDPADAAGVANGRGSLAGWRRETAATGCLDQRAGRTIIPPGTYVVARGDTLWHISKRHYRRGILYWRIYQANRRSIRNPHWIYPCQEFWLPHR